MLEEGTRHKKCHHLLVILQKKPHCLLPPVVMDMHHFLHHKRRREHTYHAWGKCKLQRFKEGGKSITFQTYDGSYGATDKVLSFI